jgi:hypothetical protein
VSEMDLERKAAEEKELMKAQIKMGVYIASLLLILIFNITVLVIFSFGHRVSGYIWVYLYIFLVILNTMHLLLKKTSTSFYSSSSTMSSSLIMP